MSKTAAVGKYGPVQEGWTFWEMADKEHRPLRRSPDGEIAEFESSHQVWLVRRAPGSLIEIKEDDLPKTARRYSRKRSGWPPRKIDVVYYRSKDGSKSGTSLVVPPDVTSTELDDLVERYFGQGPKASDVSVVCDDLQAGKSVAEEFATRLRHLGMYRVTVRQIGVAE